MTLFCKCLTLVQKRNAALVGGLVVNNDHESLQLYCCIVVLRPR